MDTCKLALSEDIKNEIFTVTQDIQEKYPELYEHLSETPLFHWYDKEGIPLVEFEQYLSSIKSQLTTFDKYYIASNM